MSDELTHKSPVYSCQRSSLSPSDWEFYPYIKKQSPSAEVAFLGVSPFVLHHAASEAVVGPRDFVRVFNSIFLSLNFIGRVKKKRETSRKSFRSSRSQTLFSRQVKQEQKNASAPRRLGFPRTPRQQFLYPRTRLLVLRQFNAIFYNYFLLFEVQIWPFHHVGENKQYHDERCVNRIQL